MGMGYCKIIGSSLKISRTPAFENCDTYDLNSLISTQKAPDISQLTLELNFKNEILNIEFMDGEAYNS